MLTVAGAYAVHHGRYLVAHCGHAHEELGGGPHGYLSLIAPLVGGLLALAAISLVVRLSRRLAAAPLSRPAVWLGTSLTLAASYGLAEMFEGRLDPAHRAGLSGALGHGGVTALVIAIAVAAVLAAIYKVSAFVIRRITKALRRRRPPHTDAAPPTHGGAVVRLPAFIYLSLHAGRGPPLLAA